MRPLYLVILYLFSFTLLASNTTFNIVKKQIKLLPEKERIQLAKDIGRFCEFAVFHMFENHYNKNTYDIQNKINYENLITKEAGELDIVIFKKNTKEALYIYEVKCSKNYSKAKRNGYSQLNRFKKNISESFSQNGSIKIFNDGNHFEPIQFMGAQMEVIMPKKGNIIHEGEFDLSLEEIETLQSYLISY